MMEIATVGHRTLTVNYRIIGNRRVIERSSSVARFMLSRLEIEIQIYLTRVEHTQLLISPSLLLFNYFTL